MKDLNQVCEECFSILDNLKIPYTPGTTISYNGRLTRKWGYCRKSGNNSFTISIASILGQDDIPEKTIKSVILHELLHTCPGCFNHGKQWKKYCKIIREIYGIKIRTTSDAESMKVKQHYYIKCRRCKIKITYAMKPRNIERQCPICGSKKLSCFYKDENEKQRLWKR